MSYPYLTNFLFYTKISVRLTPICLHFYTNIFACFRPKILHILQGWAHIFYGPVFHKWRARIGRATHFWCFLGIKIGRTTKKWTRHSYFWPVLICAPCAPILLHFLHQNCYILHQNFCIFYTIFFLTNFPFLHENSNPILFRLITPEMCGIALLLCYHVLNSYGINILIWKKFSEMSRRVDQYLKDGWIGNQTHKHGTHTLILNIDTRFVFFGKRLFFKPKFWFFRNDGVFYE